MNDDPASTGSDVSVSVVVPIYNEDANIAPLYASIVAAMDAVGSTYEIVFIDDGSRDGSYQKLREVCGADARVTLVKLRKNFGQTAALAAGFDASRGEIVISMDGDLQHDPGEIPKFLAKLDEGYDIVSGWRAERHDAWISRRLPSRIANWMMAKLSRVDLHDFGTTFKAYRREVLDDLHLYGELHRFIPALASWRGATVAEIPIKNLPRGSGQSNYGIGRTLRVALDLIGVKFLLDYSTRPLQLFGLIGLLATTTGIALGVFLLARKFLDHVDIMVAHGPLFFTTILVTLSGLQFVSFGLLGELVTRAYFESQGKRIYAVREIRRLGASGSVARKASIRPHAMHA